MMAITHAAIAIAGTSFALGTSDPLLLGLSILGSQLPDIDTSTSTIGKIFFPISSWIEDNYPHRTITHSLLATAFLTIVSSLICFSLGDISFKLAIALPLGHLLSCFSDTFTKQGVQLFYPDPAWAISVSNPRRRLKTGGAGELWVLGIAIAILVFSIYLVNGGGVTQKVSQSLGLKDGVIKVYNQNASTHHVYADIKGVWSRDRTLANGKYWILGTEGSEFIVSDGQGIYKTNDQIITERVNTNVGQPATTELRTLTFNDEEAIAKLEKIKQSNSNAAVFVNGSVSVDFPEDVSLPVKPKQITKVSLIGDKLKFSYCPIDVAIKSLRNQYAIGNIEIKIISPKPNL